MIQTLQSWASYLVPPTITESKFSRKAGYWSNPDQEKSTSFFEELTDVHSQRENWYQVTPYVAEFWCTVSNVAFIYSGIVNRSPELVFAGVASIVSHAIPKQWLLKVDKLGVLIVAMRALKEYQVLIQNPKLLIPLVSAVGLNLFDAHMARTTGATWPHLVWHCASAGLVGHFFSLARQYKLQASSLAVPVR
jgi:hypothetical protein